MITTPPVLTDDGNIRLHNREGARIPLFFTDDDGADRDMTQAVVAFLLEDGFRRVLEPGVAANELILRLEDQEFAQHIDKMVDFIVRDESVDETPVIWQGKLLVYGW